MVNQRQDIESSIQKLGDDLFRAIEGEQPGLFNKDYWQGMILDWVMKEPSFKVDMFRFVDVLPQLKTTQQVSEHIKQYLLRDNRPLPLVIATALKAATSGLTSGLATKAIKKNVLDMAMRFIVGADAKEAQKALRGLHDKGFAFTVDLLGEATVSEEEAQIYQRRYADLIVNLAEETKSWANQERIDRNHLGPIPRANVSLKISAMDPHLISADPNGAVARLKKHILPLLLEAKQRNVFVNFDLEQWDYHEITYNLFEEVVSHPELRDWPHLGIVVQAYLRHAHRDVERLYSLARSRKAPITVRLVKGAYWDFEVVRANQKGLECPVIQGKSATDANYEALSARLLDHIDYLHPAFGSHNLRSVAHAIEYAKAQKVPSNAYEIQMLYGMAEPERAALQAMGARVRIYAPVGDLLPGMSYLVRRLLENTSNSGFLQMKHYSKVDKKELLKRPQAEEVAPKAVAQHIHAFNNCPLSDFTQKSVREQMQSQIESWRRQLPVEVPVVIEGKAKKTGEILKQYCPSQTEVVATRVYGATVQDAQMAIQVSQAGFLPWKNLPLHERCRLALRLADVLQRDRFMLAALQTLEVGKPWLEADADVAEAVDFCRYYAQQALLEISPKVQGHTLGESNILTFQGRGPVVVIAPWNFPLAILCGMTIAPLIAGNTVIMKPAEQSSAVAYSLFERIREVGFPDSAVTFLPGIGEQVGPILTQSPLVASIAFTGSKDVGLKLYEQIAQTHPPQTHMKRMICEMGGKNAIVIDDDADLDEATLGVIQSAFGYSGQKCSACSRVIVVESVYESVKARLIESAKSLDMGDATDPGCVVGPVVDETAYKRLLGAIESHRKTAQLLFLGTAKSGGYFVPPAIFEVDDVGHPLMQEELFGPVLTLIRAPDFKTAIQYANQTNYALTGAVYSRAPLNLEYAQQHFEVGNLYLNRGSTGAMVDRQPFGGFKLSGLGSKAGGPGYLLHFVDPKCVSENTMRRGFTPELDS